MQINSTEKRAGYCETEILNLINYLTNIYMLKYPISNHINRNSIFFMDNIERKMTPEQRNLLRCIPYNESEVIRLNISFRNQYFYEIPSIFLEINPKTEIVDDFSIMLLAKYYHGLQNNITIQQLYDIMKEQHIDFINIEEIEQYLIAKTKLYEIRDTIIGSVLEKLESIDTLFDNTYYRRKKFLEEFNRYYHWGWDSTEIEEMLKMPIIKNVKIKTIS